MKMPWLSPARQNAMPPLRGSGACWRLLPAVFLLFLSIGGQPVLAEPAQVSASEMKQAVAVAKEPRTPWRGPQSGPPGQRNKSIAILCEDLRNGGILAVAQGVREAAKTLDWKVRVFDAGGTASGRGKAASDALASRPDGVILIGADAGEMRERLVPFAKKGIPIVGWHVGPRAGPIADSPVALNVSTDPLEVARITAMAAIAGARGPLGVVIFTDSNFKIAMAKANAIAALIKACAECTLLEIRDVAISRSAEEMPGVTHELLARHGKRWTHALAINDIYFDYAVPELIAQGLSGDSIRLLSAGDGSASAIMRIQAGSFQIGTVSEPLNLHGWQLVDELNRLFARQPINGYVVPVHLVSPENVDFDGGKRYRYDPDNGYREAYRRIWQR